MSDAPAIDRQDLGRSADLALLCAEFAARLRAAGIPVPIQRITWWTQITLTSAPTLVAELYWLARVTLVDRVEQLPTFDSVFWEVFRGGIDMVDTHRDPGAPQPQARPAPTPGPEGMDSDQPAETGDSEPHIGTATATAEDAEGEWSEDSASTLLALASETEVLRDKDFADCSAEELAQLAEIIARMRIVSPTRPSRWEPNYRSGRSIDLRHTLRAACRTGGDPIRWSHRRRGTTPRQIVMLADVSGSMQAYSAMYLRVLHGAVLGAKAHAYVFATRLHHVSRTLGRGRREDAVARALAKAPDASGGTRIGGAIKQFLATDGRRGIARGAIVVIVSDGWERADPAVLAEQMSRLARLAHRVIWVNPRKAAPGFEPVTGGMAAALPYVDTFVSGHSARAVQDLLDAIAAQDTAPVTRRQPVNNPRARPRRDQAKWPGLRTLTWGPQRPGGHADRLGS